MSPLRKNAAIFQVLLQTDRATYNNLVKEEYVAIGYDTQCKVYDAIDILQCYNCGGFNHSSRTCKSKTVCGQCSGNHKTSECDTEERLCINCDKMKDVVENIDVAHCYLDRNKCHVYKHKVSKMRDDILGITSKA